MPLRLILTLHNGGAARQDFRPHHGRLTPTAYGKDFFEHIPKYKAFCNVPDHIHYQPIIENCFNRYFEFEHDPEDGECSLTLEFLHHIFGEQYDLGLDYIQLLYQRPQQILPILCLVSAENNTGKSTFIKWLKAISPITVQLSEMPNFPTILMQAGQRG
jgi:hypothetical protein